ncbi:MAG TPA: VWA domain-containing protein, partial [Kaistiaceae bacterium]|nr:VWA domain-containing protein [Kaistiaceae bacterium]
MLAKGAAQSGARLADNIVYFARALRAAGMPVGPGASADAVRAVETAGIRHRDDFYWTLHAVFVKKREHRAVFDEAFRLFWRPRQLVEKMIAMLSPIAPARGEKEKPKAAAQRVNEALFEGKEPQAMPENPEIEIDARLTLSDRELLQKRDFAQ